MLSLQPQAVVGEACQSWDVDVAVGPRQVCCLGHLSEDGSMLLYLTFA
jgi:hypothetical protein